MPDKMALKKLSASDLTFFEWHFRNRNAGNQKSINLNADVFVRKLYPLAPTVGESTNNQIPVALTLFGPGMKGPYKLARKIIKTASYKNWRLNGEFVRNPDGDPDRFNVLKPGDLALFSFKGDPTPTSVDVVFIAAGIVQDAQLHAELTRALSDGRTMLELSSGELAGAVTAIAAGHPIQPFISDPGFDAAVEDAAFGSETASFELRRRKGRRVSAIDLAKARQNADRVGRDGEGLVVVYLERQKATGHISSVEWTADDDAAAPYDFKVKTTSGNEIKIDAKSTESEFERAIHMSAAEIAEAAGGAEQYDLYRVYNINGEGAKLRISNDIRCFAKEVMQGFAALPKGVRPDSISVDPVIFTWSDEIHVERPDGPEDDEA